MEASPVALGAVSDAHMVMERSVFFLLEVVQCPFSGVWMVRLLVTSEYQLLNPVSYLQWPLSLSLSKTPLKLCTEFHFLGLNSSIAPVAASRPSTFLFGR